MTQNLLPLLTAPEASDRVVSVDRAALEMAHTTLGLSLPFDDLELILLEALAADATVEPFALRVGQWRIDMPQRVLQSVMATGILSAAIAADGLSSVPVAVLAVVLPFLLDVERIEVQGRDLIVLARMREASVVADNPETAYMTLPPDLREQLTLLEFADVWDRLLKAGELGDADKKPDRIRRWLLAREDNAGDGR